MPAEQATNLKVPAGTTPSQLERAALSFFLDRAAAGCTAATLLWYRRHVSALMVWLSAHGVSDLAAVQADHVRTYLVELQARGLADRTRHHYASAARAFFNYAVAEGLLPVSPMKTVKMPRLPKEIPNALVVADVQALLEACESSVDPARDKAIILCLLDTGCRAREFLALNVGDVDNKTGAVNVRHGKGKKERVVFLGLKAHKALLRYLLGRQQTQPPDPLWLKVASTERMTYWTLRDLLGRLSRRADLPEYAPHTFRRTFALWSLRAGMDLVRLAKIMGHADLRMLQRYLSLVQNDLQDAHKQHGAVDTMLAGKIK